MLDESKARQLHSKALQLRESKHFLESLKIDEEALVEYAKENDTLGFTELLTLQAKTYLHMYDFTNYKPYLLLAKRIGQTAVDIVEELGQNEAKALPYFNLGKISEDAGDLKLAVESFRKAVQLMEDSPPERHNRKSVLADFKSHLAAIEYMSGDKTALDRAEESIKDLEASTDASDYEKHVWLSGAHMRIAKMLREDNRKKAQEHLMKAKGIIDSDPELVIRKEQWQKLKEQIEGEKADTGSSPA
jgi:tetratricopeptide (TPR) repeat protein